MKFIADRMLGSLAKWMRVFGLDVYYYSNIERSSLIRVAREEGRTILTRAQNFDELKHIPPYYIVRKEDLDGQLKEVIDTFKNLDLKSGNFSRCIECNELLQDISKEKVVGRVPKKAYDLNDEYKICCECNRIYWNGTHVERMKSMMEKYK